MSLAVAFPPAASSALAGSTMPGSRGFHGGLPAPVLSPCFPGFFTDSTSSQNTLCFAPLASTTTPCFPADTTFPDRPPQATVSELHDRQADNWRPLLAIADRAGGAWPELARAAACRLSGAGAEPEQGAAVPLLADLRALFARTGAAPAGDDRAPAPPDREPGAIATMFRMFRPRRTPGRTPSPSRPARKPRLATGRGTSSPIWVGSRPS